MTATGYIRDPADPRDWDATAHPIIGAAAVFPGVDLRPWLDPVEDQGDSSCCVNFALAPAFDARARIQGLDVQRISRLSIYTLARPQPLRDEGCNPRAAMTAIRDHGLVSEERWPFRPDKVNAPLPWDVFRAGADARNAEFWRIANTGEARIALIRQALSSGYPVAFATPVDAAIDDYQAGQVIGLVRGPDRGGHYMLAVGYRPSDGTFLVRNSWGPGFGDQGYCWMSAERIGSPIITDVWVLEACPGRIS